MKKYFLVSLIFFTIAAYAEDTMLTNNQIIFNGAGSNHIIINSVSFDINHKATNSQYPNEISIENKANNLFIKTGDIAKSSTITWVENILHNEDILFNSYDALGLNNGIFKDKLPGKLNFAILGTLKINYTSNNTRETAICQNVILGAERHGLKTHWWMFSNQNNIPDYQPLFYISCDNGDLGWSLATGTSNTFNLVEVP